MYVLTDQHFLGNHTYDIIQYDNDDYIKNRVFYRKFDLDAEQRKTALAFLKKHTNLILIISYEKGDHEIFTRGTKKSSHIYYDNILGKLADRFLFVSGISFENLQPTGAEVMTIHYYEPDNFYFKNDVAAFFRKHFINEILNDLE